MYIINVGNGRIFNTDTLQMISVCYESLAATLAGHKDGVIILQMQHAGGGVQPLGQDSSCTACGKPRFPDR